MNSSMAQPAQRPHQQQPPQRQQQPHDHQQQQLYYYFPELQAMELQAQPWMVATISIDDDDLTFGGKPLSTLYEEDRRRYSVGEESLPSSPSPSSHGSSEEDEEEERRGRQRDRPHFHRPSHRRHKKSSAKKDAGPETH